MSLSELMIDIPTQHEQNVFGQFDAYAKKIERTFHVTLIARDGQVKILGEQASKMSTMPYPLSLKIRKRGSWRSTAN